MAATTAPPVGLISWNTPKSSALASDGATRSRMSWTTPIWWSSSAHSTSSLKRRVLWNFFGVSVLVVGTTVEAPLATPSPTYSASPMLNVIVDPEPNFIGIESERVATADPYWTLPRNGSRIWFGMARLVVARVAMMELLG